jgi:hypothetical protein
MQRGVMHAINVLAAVLAMGLTFAMCLLVLAHEMAHADTPKGYCPNAWKIYGLFMGGAMVCNFPGNNAIRKVMNALHAKCDIDDKKVSTGCGFFIPCD